MCDIILKWIVLDKLNDVYNYLREKNVTTITRTNDDRWLVNYSDSEKEEFLLEYFQLCRKYNLIISDCRICENICTNILGEERYDFTLCDCEEE
jgi:hypothetical protein